MDQGFTVLDKRGADGGDQPAQSNEEKKKPTFVEKCFDADVLGPWIAAGMFPNKYTVDRATGLVVDSQFSYVDHDLPWIMVNNDGTRECDFYKDVDKLYNIIPPPCMCCWKVVVQPRTLKQLFQLLEIEIEMSKSDPYCFCKCGIELRPDVERNYGGYFYCNDLNQGLMRLEQVRENVHKIIAPDVPVILKRACTELERKYGPSNKWDDLVTPEWKATWEMLERTFRLTKKFTKQPTLIQKHVIMKWIAHATSIADPSIPELNNGNKIYPGYITYDLPKKEDK